MADKNYILLVDDDKDALSLLATLLKRNKYNVLESGTGQEAIECIEKHREEISVIVLDIMMPGEYDGYDVCEWIQKQETEVREIPIIVLSARSSPSEMARSFASGAFQHITKPYDVQYLLAVIKSMVHMKNIQEQARDAADKFSAIFDNAPIGIMVVNKDYEVLEISQTMRHSFDNVEPGKGCKFYEFFYGEPRTEPEFGSPLTETLRTGRTHRKTIDIKYPEGLIWWDMITAPLKDKKGDIVGAIVELEDVTHERMMEEQLVDEVNRTRKAEERMREALMRQDQIASNLMQAQRDLRQKQEQLEEAYSKLEEANEKLERLSITDELTKIYNRRYFDSAFAREVRRCERYSHPVSVFMIDIDHFKGVNDTHGHQVGDMVLSRLGHILIEQFRETDILARYGGEEFVVVLPETNSSTALAIAERLRERVEKEIFILDYVELKITVSIGSMTGKAAKMLPEKILAEADEALYKAKNTGRNKVVESPVSVVES
ncbi:MAG: diguanylate cyclase [Planctomycetota bacterium]|jgi:two-component system cell cycle response regulator